MSSIRQGGPSHQREGPPLGAAGAGLERTGLAARLDGPRALPGRGLGVDRPGGAAEAGARHPGAGAQALGAPWHREAKPQIMYHMS